MIWGTAHRKQDIQLKGWDGVYLRGTSAGTGAGGSKGAGASKGAACATGYSDIYTIVKWFRLMVTAKVKPCKCIYSALQLTQLGWPFSQGPYLELEPVRILGLLQGLHERKASVSFPFISASSNRHNATKYFNQLQDPFWKLQIPQKGIREG